MRHNARPNTKCPRRGKWNDLLLVTARRHEIEAGPAGSKTTDWKSLYESRRWGQQEKSSAARALSGLEREGVVLVEPAREAARRNSRRAITSYRLTVRGRKCADALLADVAQLPEDDEITAALRIVIHDWEKFGRRVLRETHEDPAFLGALRDRLASLRPDDELILVRSALYLFVIAQGVAINRMVKDSLADHQLLARDMVREIHDAVDAVLAWSKRRDNTP